MFIGIIAILILLFFVFLGVPIAFILFPIGAAGMVYVVGWHTAVAGLGSCIFRFISQYPYSVVPMFIFMGQLGYYSGLLTDIFEVAREWFGRLRGGLAISVVGANTVFAACSGSTISACVVIGKSSIPVMRKAGYPDSLSTGVVAASGTLAALIPPSIAIVTYGLLVEESIGKLLVGGIIPGIISALIYMGFILLSSRGIPIVEERFTWRRRLYSVRYLWVFAVIVMAVMGGIYFGICTPTEGGAVGAFVVFLLALLTRKLNWSILWQSVRATCTTTSMVLIVIVGAIVFSRFLVLANFNAELNGAVAAMQVPRAVIFLMMTLVYLTFGCFVGSLGMLVMTLPVFYPLAMGLGYDSIWFGIIVIKFCEIAFITPPIGLCLYAVRAVAPEVPLATIIRGSAPFVLMDLITIAVFYIFPQIITVLPSRM